jgi:hypothetical protein
MTTILVHKNPSPDTRARIIEDLGQEIPADYERMTQDEFDAWLAEQPPIITPEHPAEIPWAISNADMRRQLAMLGINPDLITDYLKSLPDGPAKWVALADWEYANYFERTNPMIETLRPSFGLTVEQVDAMFCACEPYPKS